MFILGDAFAKAAAADNLLLGWARTLPAPRQGSPQSSPHRSFDDHAEAFYVSMVVLASASCSALSIPHRVQLFCYPPPNAPDLFYRHLIHQLTLPLQAGKVDHAVGFVSPIFWRQNLPAWPAFWFAQSRRRVFSLVSLPHFVPDLPPKQFQIAAIRHRGEIEKAFIDLKEIWTTMDINNL
ncbi:Uncharacterised protein [Serratia fonticola]|uniref:Uncharacterized protein n=1 Tax=Serratia fonticola TaxID=47917 RepID=A0A4U9W3W5_SERFO|nr:Uncharacterised protein [Serratia fonticola]